MERRESGFSPLLILLIVAGLAAMAWLAVMNSAKPGLEEAGRAKIIEPLLQECFSNGLLLTARLEQNEKEAYEVLSETEEYDGFSKRKYRVIKRGKKLHEPETSCTVSIRRAELINFMKQIHSRFKLSEKNKKAWNSYVEEMSALGLTAPGRPDIQVTIKDCKRAKKLYDNLQLFLGVSSGYKYDFNF